jgi:DDE superfamily endonuclease
VRAVDSEGETLDLLVQPRRDKAAAVKLMRKLLKKQGYAPAGRWTSYPLSRTGWLRPRHALASWDEGRELVSMKEDSGLRLRWCAVVWVKENLPMQQHAGHPKQPVSDTA